MKKSDLLKKYKHHLTLKNFSESTVRAYMNGLAVFLDYIREKDIQEVSPEILEAYFYYCKTELSCSCPMMKQFLVPGKSYIPEY